MKKIHFICFIMLINNIYSQKELWGVYKGYPSFTGAGDIIVPAYYGNITKYDSNGENPVIVHQFDQINGKTPLGRLFMASNGKLYGTCSQGGLTGEGNTSITQGYGVLYEYDLILNKYRVFRYLDYQSNFTPYIGFIEPLPGILYGATRFKLIRHDLTTDTTTFYGGLEYSINSELIKASDGNLYGTVIFEPQNCPNSSSSSPPYNGSIIKIIPSNNSINIQYSLSCNWELGAKPSGELVEESPGRLYGTTYLGGLSTGGLVTDNYGVIFEYNFLTNTYTKKIDFDRTITGSRPFPLVKGLNGKLYGVCNDGGINPDAPIQNFGTIFEYTPSSNTFAVVHNFGLHQSFDGSYYFSGNYPKSLMRTSTGEFFGTFSNENLGMFKYDLTTNICNRPISNNPDLNAINTDNLIEICRKPSYQEFIPSTFSPCVNTPFTYDINNTNATSYIWKKDGVIVPLQTTGILTINNLIASDTGIYTCTMTNECGTTTTMNLNINVNCLDVPEVIADKNTILLYPNPTKNTISIHLPESGNYEVQDISIVNLLGQTVIGEIKNTKNIDVSSLQKGIYILQLKTNNGDWNGKFVKE